jgi:hypothetical protein
MQAIFFHQVHMRLQTRTQRVTGWHGSPAINTTAIRFIIDKDDAPCPTDEWI